MKISIYATCRNEEANVKGFLETVKDADEVVVCDTGSTDAGYGMLRNSGQCSLYQIHVNPLRFDVYRNTALALVSSDAEICVRLDLDERLSPGWRDALERAWNGVDQLWYEYEYCPGFIYYGNHVHARQGFTWKGIVHETIYGGVKSAFVRDFKITHYQSPRLRGYVLELLERQLAEERSARNLYYLGREYYYHRRWNDAIKMLYEYLKVSERRDERMDASCMLARCCAGYGNQEDAINWGFKAIAECPTREAYLTLATMMVGSPDMARGLISHALTLENRLTSIYVKPEAWDGTWIERLYNELAGT
jgi:glycosyltransferase involved in cell wall biosynthesis